MNLAIIKSVQDLESRLNIGLISEVVFKDQMEYLLGITDDESDKEYIKRHMDRDI